MTTHGKRPTRWKAEVVDADGNVQWEVLVHDFPEPLLRYALSTSGFKIRRANAPKLSGPLSLVYSSLDPTESIRAAREHAARRESQMGNALMLLIARAGTWVERSDIRAVAGDSGDRRVRELRDRNWPIEIKQLTPESAWSVRLNLPTPASAPTSWHEPQLFDAAACAVPDCPLPVDDDGLCEPHLTREERRLAQGGFRYER